MQRKSREKNAHGIGFELIPFWRTSRIISINHTGSGEMTRKNMDYFSLRLTSFGPPMTKSGFKTFRCNSFELLLIKVLHEFGLKFKSTFDGDEAKTRAYLISVLLSTFDDESRNTILEWTKNFEKKHLEKVLEDSDELREITMKVEKK